MCAAVPLVAMTTTDPVLGHLPPGTLWACRAPPQCSTLSPHQYGLYSAFMGCFVYFFLGTSRDVTLGPTAIMSLLVSFYTFHEPAYAVLLAFLSGCIQLAMGFLRLGKTLRPSCHGVPRPLPPGDALAPWLFTILLRGRDA